MSGQLYGTSDLGHSKVSALDKMIKEYANYFSTVTYPERFTYESEATDIMICGFDNMAARKLFFDIWECRLMSTPEEERDKMLLIDGRIKCLIACLCK